MHRVDTVSMLAAFLLSVVPLTPAVELRAQDTPRTAMAGAPGGTPEGWRWLSDAAARPQAGQQLEGHSGETFRFEPMAPGWHITMGPGAVLFGERERAAGRFALAATLVLFPARSDAEYGVFAGGAGLDGSAPAYTTFVVRGDGSAAVLRRDGARVIAVMPWTKFDAVVSRGSNGMARNVIQVRAEPDSVRFVVNEIVIQTFARSALALDGQFGLRIGPGIDIHITNLDVTRRLAPFPSR